MEGFGPSWYLGYINSLSRLLSKNQKIKYSFYRLYNFLILYLTLVVSIYIAPSVFFCATCSFTSLISYLLAYAAFSNWYNNKKYFPAEQYQ